MRPRTRPTSAFAQSFLIFTCLSGSSIAILRAVAIIVPAILGGLAVLVVVTVSVIASSKNKRKTAAKAPASAQPRILVHSINDDRCVGCDACVAVCPTNVLDLVDNKSRVLRFEDCIQCEACMWACPTEALVMHLEGNQPPPLKVPDIDENFETPIKGQYLIGEVSGKPLVKNAANLGRMVIEHMLRNGLHKGAASSPNPQAQAVDVAIVGSGPAGLSTALSCIYHGLSYVVLEKEQLVASTIARYPKGKLVMAEPYDVVNRSFLPVFDSSKEQIIPIWEDLMQQVGVTVKKGEAVESVQRDDGAGLFHIKTTVAQYYAQRVVLAIGSRGKPRTLGVQGENLPKVHSLLEDPDNHRGQSVLVVGGGDSALEAAIALADAGAEVSISYRSKGFNRAAPKNKATIESYVSQRRIDVYFQSQVDHLTESTVSLNLPDGSQKELQNDATFVLIGADPPTKWLEKVGVGVVEKHHQFQLGKSDEKLAGYLGADAPVGPESAAGAAAMMRGEAPPEAQAQGETQVQQDQGGARGWLKSATQIFAPQRKTLAGVPLGEFAKRRHAGDGRRDMLDPAERTRVLRMLRDVGGRMADEAPEPDQQPDAAADPREAERLRDAGLRGVTYPNIDIPKVPGLTQVLDAASAENIASAAGGGAPPPNRTVLGVPGASAPHEGHGLHAASQLREQAKQKQPGATNFPQDAKTIVEMAVPQELLKHSVGAKRGRASAQMSAEHTVVSDPRLFGADEDKTQFSPAPADASDAAGGAARSAGRPPPGQAGSREPQGQDKTLFDPGPPPTAAGSPADQRKTLFDPKPPEATGGQPPEGDQKKTLFDPGPPAGSASGADRKTLFGTGSGQPPAERGGSPPPAQAPSEQKTLFAPGAPSANTGGPPPPARNPRGEREAPGSQQHGAPRSGGDEGREQESVDARHTLRSVNVQFSDEATTAADVSELVRQMSEERKKRDD